MVHVTVGFIIGVGGFASSYTYDLLVLNTINFVTRLVVTYCHRVLFVVVVVVSFKFLFFQDIFVIVFLVVVLVIVNDTVVRVHVTIWWERGVLLLLLLVSWEKRLFDFRGGFRRAQQTSGRSELVEHVVEPRSFVGRQIGYLDLFFACLVGRRRRLSLMLLLWGALRGALLGFDLSYIRDHRFFCFHRSLRRALLGFDLRHHYCNRDYWFWFWFRHKKCRDHHRRDFFFWFHLDDHRRGNRDFDRFFDRFLSGALPLGFDLLSGLFVSHHLNSCDRDFWFGFHHDSCDRDFWFGFHLNSCDRDFWFWFWFWFWFGFHGLFDRSLRGGGALPLGFDLLNGLFVSHRLNHCDRDCNHHRRDWFWFTHKDRDRGRDWFGFNHGLFDRSLRGGALLGFGQDRLNHGDWFWFWFRHRDWFWFRHRDRFWFWFRHRDRFWFWFNHGLFDRSPRRALLGFDQNRGRDWFGFHGLFDRSLRGGALLGFGQDRLNHRDWFWFLFWFNHRDWFWFRHRDRFWFWFNHGLFDRSPRRALLGFDQNRLWFWFWFHHGDKFWFWFHHGDKFWFWFHHGDRFWFTHHQQSDREFRFWFWFWFIRHQQSDREFRLWFIRHSCSCNHKGFL
jgi:hypothetical protein